MSNHDNDGTGWSTATDAVPRSGEVGAQQRPVVFVPRGNRPGTVAAHVLAAERAIRAMHDRIEEHVTLGVLAAIAFMSPYHFNRTFRRITGLPPLRFMAAMRLDIARRLLLTTPTRVTDVCFAVGYNSLGTFVRRFTETLGVSPSRLRRLAKSPSCALLPPQRRGDDGSCTVSGGIEAPPGFVGTTFVGLFETAAPQRAPIACAIASPNGTYTIRAPLGTFHLFAMGIESRCGAPHGLLLDEALRGGGHRVRITDAGACGSTSIVLRAARPTDPPILLALPVLLARESQLANATTGLAAASRCRRAVGQTPRG